MYTFLFSESSGSGDDPCKIYSVLPEKDHRYFGYSSADKSFNHDYFLAKKWYRAGNLTMPNFPPDDSDTCGTSFPIWMKGTKNQCFGVSNPTQTYTLNGKSH